MKEFSFWVNDSFKPEGDEMSAMIPSGSFYQFVYFHLLFLDLTGESLENIQVKSFILIFFFLSICSNPHSSVSCINSSFFGQLCTA